MDPVVLFGGFRSGRTFAATWTWDGTTWTKQNLAVHPIGRYEAVMA